MAALMTPRFVVTDEEIRHVNEGTCDQIPRDQQERILVMLPATLTKVSCRFASFSDFGERRPVC